MIFIFLFFFSHLFNLEQVSFAYTSTSTNFVVIQGIQSGAGGNATSSYSTSTSFKQFGASGQAGVGTGTSTSFINNAGVVAGIVGSFPNEEAFTFSIDSNSTSFGGIAPGTLGAGTSVLSVTTGNTSGFTVYGKRDDPDTTLDLDSNTTVNIADKTAWNAGVNCASAGNATASTTEPLTLQFRIKQSGTDPSNYCTAWWGTDDTTANALFAGLPSSNEEIVYRSTSAQSQSDSVVLYNLNLPATQQVGDYSGSVTYTAVANP